MAPAVTTEPQITVSDIAGMQDKAHKNEKLLWEKCGASTDSNEIRR